jgi:hypothetical protein
VILKLFLSDGMPVLEALLKSRRENVVSMLKVLQVTTRYLHALCISTKVTFTISSLDCSVTYSLQ